MKKMSNQSKTVDDQFRLFLSLNLMMGNIAIASHMGWGNIFFSCLAITVAMVAQSVLTGSQYFEQKRIFSKEKKDKFYICGKELDLVNEEEAEKKYLRASGSTQNNPRLTIALLVVIGIDLFSYTRADEVPIPSGGIVFIIAEILMLACIIRASTLGHFLLPMFFNAAAVVYALLSLQALPGIFELLYLFSLLISLLGMHFYEVSITLGKKLIRKRSSVVGKFRRHGVLLVLGALVALYLADMFVPSADRARGWDAYAKEQLTKINKKLGKFFDKKREGGQQANDKSNRPPTLGEKRKGVTQVQREMAQKLRGRDFSEEEITQLLQSLEKAGGQLGEIDSKTPGRGSGAEQDIKKQLQEKWERPPVTDSGREMPEQTFNELKERLAQGPEGTSREQGMPVAPKGNTTSSKPGLEKREGGIVGPSVPREQPVEKTAEQKAKQTAEQTAEQKTDQTAEKSAERTVVPGDPNETKPNADVSEKPPKPKPKQFLSESQIEKIIKLVKIFLFLAVAAGILLFLSKVFSKADPTKTKEQKRKRTKKERKALQVEWSNIDRKSLSPEEEITEKYNFFLKVMKGAPMPYSTDLPPTDYSRMLGQEYPQVNTKMENVTELFTHSYYGGHEVSKNQLRHFRSDIKTLMRSFI